MKKPYDDTMITEEEFIREFDANISSDGEYVWHRDRKDRIVEVLFAGEGSPEWEFQVEDDVPDRLEKGMSFNIPQGLYHRLIKGSGKLVLRIREIT